MLLTADRSGERLDAAMARLAPELSRSAAQKLIEDGAVRLNGRAARKSDRLTEGDTLEFELPQVQEVALEAEDIPLDVVYEDADVIVVNKPKGLVVHPAAGHWSWTLVNALMHHCRDSLSGASPRHRPPHRQGHVGAADRGEKRLCTPGACRAAQGSHACAHLCLHRLRKHPRGQRHHRCADRARSGGSEENVRDEKGRPRGRDALARVGALCGLYASGVSA